MGITKRGKQRKKKNLLKLVLSMKSTGRNDLLRHG